MGTDGVGPAIGMWVDGGEVRRFAYDEAAAHDETFNSGSWIERAMRLGGVDRDTATRTLRQLDRVHADYARPFYGVEIRDPSLYHLALESTALPFDSCVELILQAARSIGVPFGV